MLAKYLNFVVFSLLAFPLFSQETSKKLTARFITDDIKIDGELDEPVWETADRANEFWQFFPSDSVLAQYPTETRILYSETTLYVAFRAEAPNDKYVVATLKRDFGGTTNDNVSLLFDTFNDGTNAFFFGITPYGVQREGLVADGGADFNNTWDIKWQAEAKRYDNYYTVEVAIPFTSLKFKEGATKWRFRAYRWNLQTNEQTTWVRVPQNQQLSNLAFMGELHFEKPLGKSRTPFAVIPYINGLTQKDFTTDETDNQFKFGGDAKIAIGNGMNLDLTVNPDFSNVEVDDIFTNLTRFELRLPEKRQFFIDNSDLFENFGNSFNEARPFFSRRIGLARDTAGNLIQNQILAGARLSGKVNENWRLGALNIQTAEDANNEIPSYNNMMLALQRKVAARSNVGVFWVNRETFGDYEFLEDRNKYNRVIGADYNLASADGIWTGKFYAHKSLQPGDSKGNLSTQATATYNTRTWTFTQDWVYINEDFRADLGFVPRRDILKLGNAATRKFYPTKGALSNHNVRFLSILFWKPTQDLMKTDHIYNLRWTANFKSQAVFTTTVSNNHIFLNFPFDPSRSGGEPLPANEGYTFNQFNASFTSNNTSLLTYSLEATAGEFFNGNQYSFAATAGFRVQPWAQMSLALNYDGIRLPAPYSDADLWLLTPRLDITFSRSLFWSTIVQYSNQRDNLGINSRLQWRFAQLSDLYLVYNDNYYTRDFGPRFRSVNLKVTYWLNI